MIQRAMLVAFLAAAFYAISSNMSPGGDGTFSSQSKPAKVSAFAIDADEDEGWGSGTGAARSGSSSAAARARAEAQRQRSGYDGKAESSGVPLYDPGKDGGWGSD
jgi:hypothetical protein